MSAVTLIERLEGVRQTAPDRWLAKCPGHDDRVPSLSVRELQDGTLLLHDFGGCDTANVLTALGMSWMDLYPEPPRGNRYEWRKPRLQASDALITLDHECIVVAVIAADMLEHREIDADTWSRLATAVERIGSARAACCPARAR